MRGKKQKPRIVDLEMAAVERLVARAKELMTAQEYELLELLVETLLTLQRLVREGRTTIARLRRLFGLAQSEKTAEVVESIGKEEATAESNSPEDEPPGGMTSEEQRRSEKPKRKGHGRDAASAYPDACALRILHEGLRPGDRCPQCGRGSLYELSEDATIVRILGQPPLVARCWKCQRLRCSGCGFIFTARAPEQAQGPKHSDSAAAMMAYLRFRAGMPHNRLGQMQRNLRTPLPASTQWDVIHERIDAPLCIYVELCRLGVQGAVLHTDDTYMRILAFMGKRRAKLVSRGLLADPERTGLFTTGIVSNVDGRTLALFLTGRQHAGENLAELLRERAAELDAAILMCDGLERNVPKGHEVVESNCGSHARRRFVEQAVNWPHECRYLLETYGKVFKLDELCRKEGLSDEQRLRRHQAESAPLMDEIKTWMQSQLKQKRVEPNSGLGEAIGYMLDRWEKLTLFLRVPGAPLHNNVVERALKMAIRHRNNSLFYRSERGALVGDVYMSVIYTAELAGENGLQYLTELMRHAKAVAADPVAWLPWNYRNTLARLRDVAPLAQEEPATPRVTRPPIPRRPPVAGARPPTQPAPPPAPP